MRKSEWGGVKLRKRTTSCPEVALRMQFDNDRESQYASRIKLDLGEAVVVWGRQVCVLVNCLHTKSLIETQNHSPLRGQPEVDGPGPASRSPLCRDPGRYLGGLYELQWPFG